MKASFANGWLHLAQIYIPEYLAKRHFLTGIYRPCQKGLLFMPFCKFIIELRQPSDIMLSFNGASSLNFFKSRKSHIICGYCHLKMGKKYSHCGQTINFIPSQVSEARKRQRFSKYPHNSFLCMSQRRKQMMKPVETLNTQDTLHHSRILMKPQHLPECVQYTYLQLSSMLCENTTTNPTL